MEKQKILIADDSEMNRALLVDILEDQYDIVEADNGAAAIDLLTQCGGNFSLLLLDIMMPEMDGFEVLAYINRYHLNDILMDLRMPHMTGYEAAQAIRGLNRADSASVPIIAMTADAFAEDIQRCLECGMNAHIAKPIDVAELTRLLKKHSRKV